MEAVTTARIIPFQVGGRTLNLWYNNRAWKTLGIDPYKKGSMDAYFNVDSLGMEKLHRFVWAGLLHDNKGLPFEEIDEFLLDSADASVLKSLLKAVVTQSAAGETDENPPPPVA